MDNQILVGNFEIPEELAKELSELLIKQSIRMDMLLNVVNDPVKYETIEKMLMPVTAKIEAIKIQITNEFVPSQYNDSKYIWNYDGWEVAKNVVNVFEQK